MRQELHILREFTLSRFRENNYNSVLGSVWSLLSPALMVVLLYSLFSSRFGAAINGYALYLLVGIVSVSFFLNGVAKSMISLVFGQELLLNTRTPGFTLIFSDLIVAGFKFLIEISLCLFISLFSGFVSVGSLFCLILIIFAFFALVTGVSLIFSLGFCIVRDIAHIWDLAGKMFLFATPVFYALTDLSEWARFLVYWANPLTPFVLAFRSIFIDHSSPQILLLLHCLSIGSCFLIIGMFLFNRFNRVMIERA